MTANGSAAVVPQTAVTGHNLPALVFGVLLIVVIICGNLLVCLSVFTEKALKTTTNYFIVSLAVADLMLAVLVLPLFVYSEVRRTWTSHVIWSPQLHSDFRRFGQPEIIYLVINAEKATLKLMKLPLIKTINVKRS